MEFGPPSPTSRRAAQFLRDTPILELERVGQLERMGHQCRVSAPHPQSGGLSAASPTTSHPPTSWHLSPNPGRSCKQGRCVRRAYWDPRGPGRSWGDGPLNPGDLWVMPIQGGLPSASPASQEPCPGTGSFCLFPAWLCLEAFQVNPILGAGPPKKKGETEIREQDSGGAQSIPQPLPGSLLDHTPGVLEGFSLPIRSVGGRKVGNSGALALHRSGSLLLLGPLQE